MNVNFSNLLNYYNHILSYRDLKTSSSNVKMNDEGDKLPAR